MELVNQRDINLRRYLACFQAMPGHLNFIQQRNSLRRALERSPAFVQWSDELSQKVKEIDVLLESNQISLTVARQKLIEIVQPALAQEEKLQLSPEVDIALQQYAKALSPLILDRDALRENANRGLLITADWTVTRDPNVHDLSTVTGILETSAD